MDIGAILLQILPFAITFIVGLIFKSPVYQRGKAILKVLSKALEDDKITAEEIQAIVDAGKVPGLEAKKK